MFRALLGLLAACSLLCVACSGEPEKKGEVGEVDRLALGVDGEGDLGKPGEDVTWEETLEESFEESFEESGDDCDRPVPPKKPW